MVVRSNLRGFGRVGRQRRTSSKGWSPRAGRANEDQSVWTFTIRPDLTFQDGSPCDSAAVKASYERLLGMNRGAVAVFSRFISDPAQMTTPDPATIVFDCGAPQPLFLTALASTYGPQVVNAKVATEHEEDGDFGNTWLQLNAEGTGTGGWKLVSFEPGRRSSSSGTKATGAAGKGTTSSESSSASSRKFRRCASSSKPAMSTSSTASAFRTKNRRVEASPDAHG